MKILINTPNYKNPQSGGVSNHYAGLHDYWNEDVRYNIVGSRGKSGRGKYWILWDVLKFIFKILFWQPAVVVINPSLAANALKRDYIFLSIAKILGKKVVVFFHGFNIFYAEKVDSKDFVNKFNKAEAFIVLSSIAKNYLLKWGITKPINLTTTKVDDKLINNYDISRRTGEISNILYLARVETEKGIYIALDVFKLLNAEYPNLKYTVVGGGSELENAKKYSQDHGIKNVVFKGMLSGDKLIESFSEGDLYLFTSYHEGMPTSVLEAMTFGLPIITRPVGGLIDFFENEKMGYMVNSFDAKDFIPYLKKFISDRNLSLNISHYNNEYGKSHFLASKVALKMERLIKNILEKV